MKIEFLSVSIHRDIYTINMPFRTSRDTIVCVKSLQRKGRIKIINEDVTKYPVYLRTKKFKVGYVPQYGGYFNDLSLQDNLKAMEYVHEL